MASIQTRLSVSLLFLLQAQLNLHPENNEEDDMTAQKPLPKSIIFMIRSSLSSLTAVTP